MTTVLLPYVNYIDDSDLETQKISILSQNRNTLYIDSALGHDDYDISSEILVASNINDPSNPPVVLINKARRGAVKKVTIFYYLDNIIAGFNDRLTVAISEIGYTLDCPLILPRGTYTITQIGNVINTALQTYLTANWAGTLPIPTSTVTYAAPIFDNAQGLYGSLTITAMGAISKFVGMNPASTFLSNGSMAVLSSKNVYPIPTTNSIARMSFYSETAYEYVDIYSQELTENIKIQSTSNKTRSYQILVRLNNLNYGENTFNFYEPLNWINFRNDKVINQIDFRLQDKNGNLIEDAIMRDLRFRMEFIVEK